jgi:hypothetical protein
MLRFCESHNINFKFLKTSFVSLSGIQEGYDQIKLTY